MLGIKNLVPLMKGTCMFWFYFELNPKLCLSVSGPVMLKMPEKEPMMLSMSLVVVIIMLASMFIVMFFVGRWYLLYTKHTRKKVKVHYRNVLCQDFDC